jgi:hypothetical protein
VHVEMPARERDAHNETDDGEDANGAMHPAGFCRSGTSAN